jgi:uncharacterized protein
VAFIREVVPRRAIALIARLRYNEPYVAMPMRHRITYQDLDRRALAEVRYQWKQDRWYTVEAVTVGQPELPGPGSEEEFITEHYWGYTAQRDGGALEYKVEHPQWPVWQAQNSRLDCDAGQMYGSEFREALGATPHSVVVAMGSPVVVYRSSRLVSAGPSAYQGARPRPNIGSAEDGALGMFSST